MAGLIRMEDCPKKRVARALIDSYHEVGGINRIDCSNLPSKPAVALVCEDLLRLLFPGFHDEEPIASEDLDALTERRIFELVARLVPEVAKSLSFSEQRGGIHEQSAEDLVCEFSPASRNCASSSALTWKPPTREIPPPPVWR